jgi:hypothetical protein
MHWMEALDAGVQVTPASYWKQVREAEAKATPGAWEATVDDHGDDWLELSYTIVLGSDHDNWKDDAAFIAIARTALPLALARIEELWAALHEISAGWSCSCSPRLGQCPTCIARAALGES